MNTRSRGPGFGSFGLMAWVVIAFAGCDSGTGPNNQGGAGTSGGAGTTGVAGTTGAAGTTGVAGTTGAAGTAGAAGRGGTTGAAGRGGTTGTAGTTGAAATTGAAGNTGTGGAIASTGCGKTTWPASDMTYTIDVSGTSRSYVLSLPASYDNTQPHQLVFAWHGRTGTAMQIANQRFYNLKMTGRMPNAIFIAGQGLGTSSDPADTGWPNTGGQDIAFVRAALAYLNANLCVDQARIFSVGFSYGGIMSHNIACQMSDTFRAIAPIAGARFGGGGGNTCLTRPIAAWMTHGTMDSSTSGGVDFSAGESARDRVVTLNHCMTATVAVDPSPCVAYQGCDAGYAVHWCPHTGAHTIPSFAAPAIATFFNQF